MNKRKLAFVGLFLGVSIFWDVAQILSSYSIPYRLAIGIIMLSLLLVAAYFVTRDSQTWS